MGLRRLKLGTFISVRYPELTPTLHIHVHIRTLTVNYAYHQSTQRIEPPQKHRKVIIVTSLHKIVINSFDFSVSFWVVALRLFNGLV